MALILLAHPDFQQSVANKAVITHLQAARPHDEIRIGLQYDAEKNKLAFKITAEDKPCASGRIVFEAV